MRTNETGGDGAGFPDCRDPDCEACRASREHGVTWERAKCLGAIRSIDINTAENRAAYALAKHIELHALVAGGDLSTALSGLVGAAISIANRCTDPDAAAMEAIQLARDVLQTAMEAIQLARDVMKSRASGGLPS